MPLVSNLDIAYFIEHANEFNRLTREYECEVPKGNCWHITVKHIKTGEIYSYYEEDNYYSLQDQIEDYSDPQWGRF